MVAFGSASALRFSHEFMICALVQKVQTLTGHESGVLALPLERISMAFGTGESLY